MAIDIRAQVSCSLGTVISGSFADDYLQGSGLIKTRGEVVLAGTQTPVVGTQATFTYVKGGTTYTLPRVLRVLSSFADPFRRTTTVQLGCKLTYLENRKPPVENPNSKDENAVPCYVYAKATLPISATYVFQHCLTALGLSSDAIPLTNKFSLEEFDLTPGYLQVMSDLLQSEGYVGYLDSTETLRFRDLSVTTGTGPVITPDDVIDLGPIGSGDLPGESVVVRWSNLRLLPPEQLPTDERLRRNWELEEVYGAPVEVSVSYTDDAGNTFTDQDVFYPYTFTATRYDKWDRKIESVSMTLASSAEVNNRWASDTFKQSGKWNVPVARLVREVLEYRKTSFATNNVDLLAAQQPGESTTTIKAELVAAADAETELASLCKQDPPDGYDVVQSQTTTSYFSEMELAGSLSIDSYIPVSSTGVEGSVLSFSTAASEIESSVVVDYDTDDSAGVTKTVTQRTISRSQTVSGQQDLAKLAQDVDATTLQSDVDVLLAVARRQVYVGAETRSTTQREYGLQRRPSQADRNNTANTKPQVTESVADLTWVVGSTTSTAVTEFTLPYAPDDAISWSEVGGYTSTESDVKQKALRYGRIQNALLLGNRNGVSLQLAPELLPKRPFDPLYLQAGGITASYRVNGSSWAFDSNGIVASTDALLWGAVSATAGTDLSSSWVPLAPGTTSLPLPYTASSGTPDSETGVTYSAVITPTVVLAPYVESVTAEGVSRSTVALTEYPYTLDRGTEQVVPVSRSTATVSQTQGMVVVLTIKPGLGDVQRVDPGAGDITETRTLNLGIKTTVVKYEAPLVVFGHTDTVTTGGTYLTLARVYANSVQNITTSLNAQPAARIVDVALSPDGSRMAYLQRDTPYLGWYSISSSYAFTQQSTPADQPLSYGQAVFSPRGQHLFVDLGSTSPFYALFRTTASGFDALADALDVAPTDRIKGFAYSADDRYLAITYTNILRVYERTGDAYATVATVTLTAAVSISTGGLSWTRDNGYLAAGYGSTPYVDVFSFDGTALTPVASGITTPSSVRDVQFSPDGTYLALILGSAPYLHLYKRTGSTFTQLTTSIPTSGAPVRAINWMGFSDYFVIQSTSQGTIWAVDTTSDTFAQVTDSPFALPADVYSAGSMAVFPLPTVVPTPATGGTETVLTRLSMTATGFDPNNIQTFQAVNAAPRLGATPATSSTGWTLIQDANADDANTAAISLPFNVTIAGTSNNTIYVGSNSYITFGAGSSEYTSDASWPELLKLMITAGDASYQRVYTKIGANYALIRFEGFNEYSGTTPGNSNMIWEVAFTEPNAGTGGQVIEVRMGINEELVNPVGNMTTIDVADTTTSLANIAAAQNTSYIIEGDSTGTTWTFTSGASLTAI